MGKPKLYNQVHLGFLEETSIRSIWDRVQKSQTRNFIDLSLGNPQTNPPDAFFKALQRVLLQKPKEHFLSYMDNAGYGFVRNAIAADLRKTGDYPNSLKGEHIVMTVGVSGGINCILYTLLNPGDEVVTFSPYFVDYPKYIVNNRGVAKVVALKGPDFAIEPTALEKAITHKTKAVIFNSPNNPTGRVYTDKEVQSLLKIIKAKNRQYKTKIFLISDEVYRDIIYDRKKFISPFSNYHYSFMLYSYSKSLNIPGERIGYIAIHPDNPETTKLFNLLKLANRVLGFTNAPALAQRVIAEVLPLKFNIEAYQRKRDTLAKSLTAAGFKYFLPQGAFYFFVQIPIEKKRFFRIMESEGLFTIPSNAFGTEGFFRLAFCVDDEVVRSACRKIERIGHALKI